MDAPMGSDEEHFSDAMDHIPSPSPLKPPITTTITTNPNPNPPILNKKMKPNSKKKKKSSKSTNSVWTKSTSKRGKKKSSNNNHNNNNNNNHHPHNHHSHLNPSASSSLVPSEDTVLITPIPRFPDKSDDSPDLPILLSRVNKAEKVDLSDDRLTAASTKGYRMVRATRGVRSGSWYFEVKILNLGPTGHARLGWSTEKGDLQAPVGYDGSSYGYRDVDGSKVHKALRDKYGDEGYGEGDVIGFYISLPEGDKYAPQPPHLVWYKGQRYMYSADAKDEGPKVVPGRTDSLLLLHS